MTDIETSAAAIAGRGDDLADPTGAIPPPRRAAASKPVPEGPRVKRMREALERYGNAALSLAKAEDLIEGAKHRLAQLREDVANAGQELVELGLAPPRRVPPRSKPRPVGGGVSEKNPAGVSVSDLILEVLQDGPRTAAQIADTLGLTGQQIGVPAAGLERRGKLTRQTDAEGRSVWALTSS